MLNTEQSTSRKAVSPVRVVAAGVTALVLLASSFSAVQGGSLAGYGGGGGGDDDDDDGLSGVEIAAGAIVGVAVGYFLAASVDDDDDDDDDDEQERTTSSGTAIQRKVESVRVTPQKVRLERGAAQDFQVQVRYAGEQLWQNVTGSPQATLKLTDASGRLVAMDGAKNVFTAPVDAKGGPATVQVVASYAGAQATSTVAVQ